jgi:hypothetical protein
MMSFACSFVSNFWRCLSVRLSGGILFFVAAVLGWFFVLGFDLFAG